ncbi:MAG: phosphoribosylformylglycinamidine synthase [Bacteroidota bacterium]|nr:phosphoribosylformylglycinamidine synthase [Bacteroidota bacterium]
MICFFGDTTQRIFALQIQTSIDADVISKLSWLFGDQPYLRNTTIDGVYVGPRVSMVTPWSTNAVEITQNMGIEGIFRIEQFTPLAADETIDPMASERFDGLDQNLFRIDIKPEPIREIDDISAYNKSEGLSLNSDEVSYLKQLSKQLGRSLTDSEVFGFSQVNSEHCRHKIFNGSFDIDGVQKEESLFSLIKNTSKKHPENLVSAYKDNVAFIKGPIIEQFSPQHADKAGVYRKKSVPSIISLKAETHNFPTTVEPFSGAATGSGGEIRDRMAGGTGSIPLAGTAVYMTSYPRTKPNRPWEHQPPRDWLYQTPLDILIRASNGASDFGNKFGQPLITGSLLTFEHEENGRTIGYDKVIMLAGGVGYAHADHSAKRTPKKGDRIVILGGDNYRIGMGGAAVSSADTGAFSSGIELNAVQRSNPEMQKRVSNVIRALAESDDNMIISIHDHGAGGHLNCLSELVEDTGGIINIDALPIGDKTLSEKEIIGNESQERMGLIVSEKDLPNLQKIAERERAPLFDVGYITEDNRFVVHSESKKTKPIDLSIHDFFGKTPKTVLVDQRQETQLSDVPFDLKQLYSDVESLLQLESVACKDWLTNKVDRCVGGRVAQQQTVGSLQLPLANCGVVALDYLGEKGIATSIGHAPAIALIDAAAGSRISIAEALTNIIWAPFENGLSAISLSANWMWPCNNPGEDERLYSAVEACAAFAISLGVNIPTGKDSLSMKQKYSDKEVLAPGTVIISASAHCSDIKSVVRPMARLNKGKLYYIPMSDQNCQLGGTAYAQLKNCVGNQAADVSDAALFKVNFDAIQELVKRREIYAGHDIGSGGLITTLLEMCFAENKIGLSIDLSSFDPQIIYAENPAVVIQINAERAQHLKSKGISIFEIGEVNESDVVKIQLGSDRFDFHIPSYRKHWMKTSYLMDNHQTVPAKAKERFESIEKTPLTFSFPSPFDGKLPNVNQAQRIKAAIIREKGSNSEREMAYMMDLAGFEVKDIHMTDLMSGQEDLRDVQLIVAVGGFSNSDVLGSAKGWAGTFTYNALAKKAITDFFQRRDTLSLGVCNGCQLFVELGLLHPTHKQKPKMKHNDSGKFECVFSTIDIQSNNTVLFQGLSGTRLGIWSAHGEGRFTLSLEESNYQIVGKYSYDQYPANPNGSDYGTAILSSDNGRHVVMMPHLERSIFPWNWAHYPDDRKEDIISPWVKAFVDANKWFQEGQ